MQDINLNNLSITEKKAMAYDILANIENLQRQLQIVNQSIANESNKIKEPVKDKIENNKPKEK